MLVLDEVHEWNENMEVLTAWSKKRAQEDPSFKVVFMSATMEADTLAAFHQADTDMQVPIIEVPGRTFDVDKKEGGDVVHEAVRLAKEGKNTLVFVPGKEEINRVIEEIQLSNIPNVTILPLHGQLDSEEQRKAFKRYQGAKVIVATNVAQTSITINDIDAVVDSGLERRNEVKNGVEGLYLRPISRADCLQRAGRAGRTKEGEYVLARLDNNPFSTLEEREAYATPEILRTRLDGMVLRLARSGFDATELEFYHQPDSSEIAAAKDRLKKLGALDEDGEITAIGKDMARMPVESHYARMMIEARKYSKEVRLQLAATLAVEEADGILFNGKSGERRWKSLLSDCNDSDMIKQLEVFIASRGMSTKEKKDYDIIMKNASKAEGVFRQLRQVERLSDSELSLPSTEERAQLVTCIIAGMVDNLYINNGGRYHSAGNEGYEMSNRSLVRAGSIIVGMPFHLQIQTRYGARTLNLLQSVTNVPSTDVLREVAPQLFTQKVIKADAYGGRAVEVVEERFNGRSLGINEVPIPPSERRREMLVNATLQSSCMGGKLAAISRQIANLQSRTSETLPSINRQELYDLMVDTVPLTVETIKETNDYIPDLTIDYYISPEKQRAILAASPGEYCGMRLEYINARPVVRHNIDDESLLAMNEDSLQLPDGREIFFHEPYGNSCSLRDLRRKAGEKQERLLQEELDRQARLREEEVRHQEELQRQEKRRQVAEEILKAEQSIYREDISDLPEYLLTPLENATQELENIKHELNRYDFKTIEDYEDRLQKIVSDAQSAWKAIEDWKSGKVTDEALASLMNRFNSR